MTVGDSGANPRRVVHAFLVELESRLDEVVDRDTEVEPFCPRSLAVPEQRRSQQDAGVETDAVRRIPGEAVTLQLHRASRTPQSAGSTGVG